MAADNHNENNVSSNLKADRQYLIDSGTNRMLMGLLLIVGIVLISVLLFLASFGKTGRYVNPDTSQYEATLNNAATMLKGGAQVSENADRVTLPIDTAIRAVADKGLGNITTSLKQTGTPVAEVAPVETTEVETNEVTETTVVETAVVETVTETSNTATNAVTNAGMATAATAAAGTATVASGIASGGDATTTVAATANTTLDYTTPDYTINDAAYNANCLACHQVTGEGLPGAFPPLKGHIVDLYKADPKYLVNLLIYGMQGEIEIDGATYNGIMPAWGLLSDQEIADTLNYELHSWGNDALLPGDFVPYTAADIAAERGKDLSMQDIHAMRASFFAETTGGAAAAHGAAATSSSTEEAVTEAVTETVTETVVTQPEMTQPEVIQPEVVETTTQVTETTTTSSSSNLIGVAPTSVVASSVLLANGMRVDVNKDVYSACSACHQANGEGIITVFPPLANHAAKLFNADRDYLANVVLYGIEGTIQVDGLSYNQPMRGYPELSDADIAGVLNYVLTTWGNESLLAEDFRPYEAKDIAGLRGQRLSPELMQTMRTSLNIE